MVHYCDIARNPLVWYISFMVFPYRNGMNTAFTICASAIFMQAAIAGEVPSLPLKSADGCFIATAADDNLAARATALDFAGDIRSGLRRLTG